jgi:hypothetical protein
VGCGPPTPEQFIDYYQVLFSSDQEVLDSVEWVSEALETGDVDEVFFGAFFLGESVVYATNRAYNVPSLLESRQRQRLAVERSNRARGCGLDDTFRAMYDRLPYVYRRSNQLAARRIHTLLQRAAEKAKNGKSKTKAAKNRAAILPSVETIRKRLAKMGFGAGRP